MKQFIKNNLAIFVAFLLPFLLILFVVVSIYLPKAKVKTAYDFVYTTCGEDSYYYSYPYNCNDYSAMRYVIEGNKLVEKEVTIPINTDSYYKNTPTDYKVRIFVHDTSKNESREVTLDEAKSFTFVNSLLTSPDGVNISNNYSGGSDYFLFFGGSSYDYGYYLTKSKSKTKLNLINSNDRYSYQNNMHVLGWLKR